MHKTTILCLFGLFFLFGAPIQAQKSDTISFGNEDLIIHFIGHGSLQFQFKGKNIYIDPYSNLTDYGKLPKADMILVTHHHGDHFDANAIDSIYTSTTTLIYTQACMQAGKTNKSAKVMANGESVNVDGIEVKAVPAYNLVNMRNNGSPYHPKGEGNGYIISFGKLQVYVAGDTENIPEMKTFGKIDIAFIPMNLPYTMTPEMTADAARMVKPKILYPYHFGSTETSKLLDLLKNQKGIETRIRDMQ